VEEVEEEEDDDRSDLRLALSVLPCASTLHQLSLQSVRPGLARLGGRCRALVCSMQAVGRRDMRLCKRGLRTIMHFFHYHSESNVSSPLIVRLGRFKARHSPS